MSFSAMSDYQETLLSVINVGHDYQDLHVLTDINFSLLRGDISALLGENGVGKSTLLRIISGITRPTSGEVVIGGFDVRKDRVRAHQILGYLPDVPFFYQRLRGSEHLALVASIMGGSIEQGLSYAKRLGLSEETLQRPVGEYSLGTKQKLALGAAFCNDITVLIMDEPFASLDIDSRAIAMKMISEFAGSGGAVLFVTHDSRDLDPCTRILKLQTGTLHEVQRDK